MPILDFPRYEKKRSLFKGATCPELARYIGWSGRIIRQTYDQKGFICGIHEPSAREVFVKSSQIISTGYSRDNRSPEIKFDRNVVSSYLRVLESIFTVFLEAESHGNFAHRQIFNKFAAVCY